MFSAQIDHPDEARKSEEISNLMRAREIAWSADFFEELDVSYELTSYGELQMIVTGEEGPMLELARRCKEENPPVNAKAVREDDETPFRLL